MHEVLQAYGEAAEIAQERTLSDQKAGTASFKTFFIDAVSRME